MIYSIRWRCRKLRLAYTIAFAIVIVAGLGNWQIQRSFASTLIYFHGGGTHLQRGLYNFDTDTGVSTLRATVGGTAERFDAMTSRPADGVVFAVSPRLSTNGTDLYTINVNNGAFTHLAELSFTSDYIVNIAFNPFSGTLYGLQRNGPGLFTIDQVTGQCTQVATKEFARAGFDFAPDGRLFGTGTNPDNSLYQINAATGAETGFGHITGSDLLEDAAFTLNGEMFVTEFRSGDIFRYDTATGTRTIVGTTDPGVTGIIAVPVPESSTLALMACGLATCALYLASRRPNQRP